MTTAGARISQLQSASSISPPLQAIQLGFPVRFDRVRLLVTRDWAQSSFMIGDSMLTIMYSDFAVQNRLPGREVHRKSATDH